MYQTNSSEYKKQDSSKTLRNRKRRAELKITLKRVDDMTQNLERENKDIDQLRQCLIHYENEMTILMDELKLKRRVNEELQKRLNERKMKLLRHEEQPKKEREISMIGGPQPETVRPISVNPTSLRKERNLLSLPTLQKEKTEDHSPPVTDRPVSKQPTTPQKPTEGILLSLPTLQKQSTQDHLPPDTYRPVSMYPISPRDVNKDVLISLPTLQKEDTSDGNSPQTDCSASLQPKSPQKRKQETLPKPVSKEKNRVQPSVERTASCKPDRQLPSHENTCFDYLHEPSTEVNRAPVRQSPKLPPAETVSKSNTTDERLKELLAEVRQIKVIVNQQCRPAAICPRKIPSPTSTEPKQIKKYKPRKEPIVLDFYLPECDVADPHATPNRVERVPAGQLYQNSVQQDISHTEKHMLSLQCLQRQAFLPDPQMTSHSSDVDALDELSLPEIEKSDF